MKRTEEQPRPRIGIPYRTRNEELRGIREKYDPYLRAVESAGGAPVEISLGLELRALAKLARSLDAVLLPGSPADVNPALYRAFRHAKTAEDDADRERTDLALLEHAVGEGKPVLAICYGVQILNVHLGGSLIQDIASELRTEIEHAGRDPKQGKPEPRHEAYWEKDSRAAGLSGDAVRTVNSSHHQSIREPGKNLRVTGRAPDGVVEAVEWTKDGNWITGVQWHPERIPDDSLSNALFRDFTLASCRSRSRFELRPQRETRTPCGESSSLTPSQARIRSRKFEGENR